MKPHGHAFVTLEHLAAVRQARELVTHLNEVALSVKWGILVDDLDEIERNFVAALTTTPPSWHHPVAA